MTTQDLKTQPPGPSRTRLILFALGLAAISLFMYVGFIVKTAVKGP